MPATEHSKGLATTHCDWLVAARMLRPDGPSAGPFLSETSWGMMRASTIAGARPSYWGKLRFRHAGQVPSDIGTTAVPQCRQGWMFRAMSLTSTEGLFLSRRIVRLRMPLGSVPRDGTHRPLEGWRGQVLPRKRQRSCLALDRGLEVARVEGRYCGHGSILYPRGGSGKRYSLFTA